MSTELVSKDQPPWSDDVIVALLQVWDCYRMQMFLLLPVVYTYLQLLCIEKKDHDIACKMAMTLGVKMKIIRSKFLIDCICHMVSTCYIKFIYDEHVVWGLPRKCMMTYCDHRERVSIWVSCLLCFQYWWCGTMHHPLNLCTLCRTERQ